MKRNLFAIIGKEKIYIREDNTEDYIWIEGQKNIPNVPFYHYLMDDDADIKKCGYKYKAKLFVKPYIFVSPVDDINNLEQRGIMDYFKVNTNVQNLVFLSQSFLNCKLDLNGSYTYISLSKTIRCICINYIKNGQVEKEIFLEKNASIEEINNEILKIKQDEFNQNMNVYVNNVDEDMGEYSDIGQLIGREELFKNMKDIIAKFGQNK